MKIIARLLLLPAALALVPAPSSAPSPQFRASVLSRADREEGAFAARLAGHSPRWALRWLRQQAAVQHAQLGLDAWSIDVQFRDGAELAILRHAVPGRQSHDRRLRELERSAQVRSGSASGRAVVLEPYANQLGLGPDAGKPEVDALTQAGFQVDVVRNGDVTVGVMEKLADYSVVYMETHSGVLPDGDAIVTTGETDAQPYAALFVDGSVLQAFVAGDPTRTLYIAIKAKFVSVHMGTFPDSSIMFLNGCSLLAAPVFWSALHQKNVATMISWDLEVSSTDSEPAGEFVLDDLAKGDSVQSDIAAAYAVGLGTSIVGDTVAKLGYLGDGDDTLSRALAGATPTPTPVPTDTPTPTATPSPTHVARLKCKRGQHVVHGKCRPKHRRCKGQRCKKHR